MVSGEGNPDPSRADARDRPAGGRDDRGVLQDSVGGADALPARRCDGPRPDTPANSRRVRDRRRNKCQKAAHTPGTCAPEGPVPRGRSAKRAPSTIHGDIRQNEQRLIRPAAASIRSRGPGVAAPGPHASLSRAHLISTLFRRRQPVRTHAVPSPRPTILLLSIRPEGGWADFGEQPWVNFGER